MASPTSSATSIQSYIESHWPKGDVFNPGSGVTQGGQNLNSGVMRAFAGKTFSSPAAVLSYINSSPAGLDPGVQGQLEDLFKKANGMYPVDPPPSTVTVPSALPSSGPSTPSHDDKWYQTHNTDGTPKAYTPPASGGFSGDSPTSTPPTYSYDPAGGYEGETHTTSAPVYDPSGGYSVTTAPPTYNPSGGYSGVAPTEPTTPPHQSHHTNTTHDSSGGDVPAPAAPVTHMFTLIKAEGGDGSVYVLNNRGERFHVSETLSHEMQAGGSWYEPEVKAASEVDKMPLRYTVDSVQNLGTINNATVNDLMFVKGDGGPLDNNTLVGNGNAVYAVNVDGQKFHVTEGGYNDIVAQNGGAAPPIATITQAAVDSSPVSGAIADSGGATVTTTDPLMDKALASAAVVLGDTTNNSPLPGAVITATTAPAIPVAAPPPPDPSAVLTEGPFAGYTNSQVKTFTDGVTAASAAAAPAPAPAPAAPAAAIATAPAVRTDEALAVGNSAENTGQFQIIKGDATNYKPDNELVGNGRAIFVVNAAGQKFHVTGDLMNAMIADGTWHDPDVKPQAEVDSKPFGSGVSLTNIDQLRSINIGAGSEFKLVKDADNESVYAINSSGERYHVSAQLAGEMGASFSNIDTLNPGESNKFGAVKGELNSVADLNKATKDQSASAGGFDGDTSAIPGGFPPVQGYTTEHQ